MTVTIDYDVRGDHRPFVQQIALKRAIDADEIGYLIESVERGLKTLDNHVPGWVQKVNMSEFDIRNTDSCILGEVFGSYMRGQNELHALMFPEDDDLDDGADEDNPSPLKWPEMFGFEAPDLSVISHDDQYYALQALWTDVILDRQI